MEVLNQHDVNLLDKGSSMKKLSIIALSLTFFVINTHSIVLSKFLYCRNQDQVKAINNAQDKGDWKAAAQAAYPGVNNCAVSPDEEFCKSYWDQDGREDADTNQCTHLTSINDWNKFKKAAANLGYILE